MEAGHHSRFTATKASVVFSGIFIFSTFSCIFPLTSGGLSARPSSSTSRPNILFIVSDDLRQELNNYCEDEEDCPSPVHPKLHTPYLDALAARSLVLRRAYVQQAVCNPSRTSFLTGRRPDTTHVYSADNYFRKVGGDFTTIPEYFKQQGYEAVGLGKIFHPGEKASGNDDPKSWSVPYYHAPNEQFWKNKKHGSWMAVNKTTYYERPLPDIQIAAKAVQTLRQLGANGSSNPFFLAVGFHKPHMPFIFPDEFLKYYPADSVHCPPNPNAPQGMPEVAFHMYDGILGYPDIKKLGIEIGINKSFPEDLTLQLRRAYYSSTSYIDAMVGWVLKELKDNGFEQNTIVSFVGDHGWQLGEHSEWGKQTNFELATHAPMMVAIPGQTDRGAITKHLTEFVDLFPSLVEAAGFPPLPTCPEDASAVRLCTEGRSFLPLLSSNTTSWADFAFSQFPRSKHRIGDVMGYSIRTPRYRYTEWPQFHYSPTYKPNWEKLYGVELYDHNIDPQENVNRAHDPSYKKARQMLKEHLRAGWRARG